MFPFFCEVNSPGRSLPSCFNSLRLQNWYSKFTSLLHLLYFVVQWLSCVQLFEIAWTAAHQVSLSLTNSRSLPKLIISIESVLLPNHLILHRPLLLLPSIFLSIRVFSSESALHIRWSKYWSFSEQPGLISFQIDWLDLLAVQGTLKGLLQQRSSKASILQCSASFTVQLSHPYTTTGKTIVLSDLVDKVGLCQQNDASAF